MKQTISWSFDRYETKHQYTPPQEAIAEIQVEESQKAPEVEHFGFEMVWNTKRNRSVVAES